MEKKTDNKSPSYSPDLSPLSSLNHRSSPPSDHRHVSPSHPSKPSPRISSSSLELSPLSSPPSDHRHVSPSHPPKNNISNNNTIGKSSFKAPSVDSSPSSDLCHVSPSPPHKNVIIKPHFDNRSLDSSPPSDLCHMSPSPPLKNGTNYVKPYFHTPSGDSGLRHVSPTPTPARGVRREKTLSRLVRREKEVRNAALGVRLFGAVFCLVSLVVMAVDKERGWAVDSFYRYKEFRYCISVNVVGFLYSVIQTCDLVFTLCTGKYVFRHQYRLYFDFSLDQILTYLLMSASSSAATRVDDWESNWGKDQFPMMASISVGLSFMSFVALAASTLISGYALCTWSST